MDACECVNKNAVNFANRNITPPTLCKSSKTVHFTNTDLHPHGTVLLKTAIANVFNHNKMSPGVILFDEGATKSFIKKELTDKLHMKPVRQEVINLAIYIPSI